MVKTRSQTGNITVKKEDEEDCNPSLGLRSVRNTRSSGRISKREPAIINNGSLPAPQVKAEDDTDTKSLLKLVSNSSKLPKGQYISQEQINQLVDYIVNDNMSVTAAARKVNIGHHTGAGYYNLYKNDPEKKIPVPRNRHGHLRKYCTQEQIGNIIRYINNDKMTVKEALAKANMPLKSGNYYYNKYLEDPDRNIPVPNMIQRYTQDQKEAFIGYIVRDKMSIPAAAKKAKINPSSAKNYYHKYFKVQNPDMPTPSHIVTPKHYTQ